MKILKIFTLFLFLTALFSCDNEKIYTPVVNTETIISPELYEKPDDDKTIIDARIVGDLLVVTVGASGCDGSTWTGLLIDKGLVAESYPVQRFVRVKFTNKEFCLASVSRVFSFDLKPLRVNGDNRITICLTGWEKNLLYVY